jgi:hypothetical protein
MKTDSSAPADTQMMGIVHHALSRDLARAVDALSRTPAPGAAQRVAIAQHVQVLMRMPTTRPSLPTWSG